MVRLHARIQPWEGAPQVLRVTTSSDRPPDLRPREALLTTSGGDAAALGFGARLVRSGEVLDCPGAVALPEALAYLGAGDVVRLVPRVGEIAVLYRRSSLHNSMLLTENCNSNCLMCSQPPKVADDSYLTKVWLEAISLMSPETQELGITGGEPTLLGERLLEILQACREHLPSTSVHLLSNGRLFTYLSLAQKVAAVGSADLMIGIPLYSDLASRHDYIVQAAGAFDQTIRGIVNLKRCGVRVELRVVLHRETVDRLPQLARFVTRNLPFVDHIALMGLEMMGYTKANLDSLWIDPFDYQAKLRVAVDELRRARMNVSIYNHQLCVLASELWPFAKKSISDWKNEYVAACGSCGVREECGGFFSSSLSSRYSRHITPVPRT